MLHFAMLVITRWHPSQKNPIKTSLSYGFPMVSLWMLAYQRVDPRKQNPSVGILSSELLQEGGAEQHVLAMRCAEMETFRLEKVDMERLLGIKKWEEFFLFSFFSEVFLSEFFFQFFFCNGISKWDEHSTCFNGISMIFTISKMCVFRVFFSGTE